MLGVAAQVENKIKSGPATETCTQLSGISTRLYMPPLIGKVQIEGKSCDHRLSASGVQQCVCKTLLPHSKSVFGCGQTQT